MHLNRVARKKKKQTKRKHAKGNDAKKNMYEKTSEKTTKKEKPLASTGDVVEEFFRTT